MSLARRPSNPMKYRGASTNTATRRGVLTTVVEAADDALEAFFLRQQSRVQSRVHMLYQRHQRRVGEHARAAYTEADFETRGLSQPWNRTTTDNRL